MGEHGVVLKAQGDGRGGVRHGFVQVLGRGGTGGFVGGLELGQQLFQVFVLVAAVVQVAVGADDRGQVEAGLQLHLAQVQVKGALIQSIGKLIPSQRLHLHLDADGFHLLLQLLREGGLEGRLLVDDEL